MSDFNSIMETRGLLLLDKIFFDDVLVVFAEFFDDCETRQVESLDMLLDFFCRPKRKKVLDEFGCIDIEVSFHID